MYTWKINREIIEDLVVLSFLEYKFVCCVFFFLQKKKKKKLMEVFSFHRSLFKP